MTRTVALVTGVGPGTGSAIVKRFAQGPYEVAMIARSGERLCASLRTTSPARTPSLPT